VWNMGIEEAVLNRREGGWFMTRSKRLELILPPISIIIPAYNEARWLPGTLDALLASKFPAEVIVVDDGSTDDTARVLEAYRGRIRVLTHEVNRGKGAATSSRAQAASSAESGASPGGRGSTGGVGTGYSHWYLRGSLTPLPPLYAHRSTSLLPSGFVTVALGDGFLGVWSGDVPVLALSSGTNRPGAAPRPDSPQ